MDVHVSISMSPSISNPCDQNAIYDNTIGSYECGCLDGLDGDGMTCEDEGEFLDGSAGDDFKCSGINECKKSIRNCDSNAKCADGYDFKEKDDGTFEGTDVDECDVDAPTDNCVGNHTKCTNTVGSFTCDCDTDKHVAGQGVMNGDGTECIDFESCTGNKNEC